MPAWIPYTLLRVGLFGGTFAVLFLLGVEYWIAAIAGAVVGLTVSYIFFPRLRNRVAEEFAAACARSSGDEDGSAPIRGEDEEAEDRDDERGPADS